MILSMVTAICPGSFDPITVGHVDIIKRAANMFDKVIVLVAHNKSKTSTFTVEERVEFIRRVTKDIPNVEADSFDGLLVDYVREKGAKAIVKGLRAVSDFEYEFQMALVNKKLYPQADTIFLTTSAENMYLSSSVVKQVGSMGGDISPFIPPQVLDDIKIRLMERKE
mgnify:CR=1 FL=1